VLTAATLLLAVAGTALAHRMLLRIEQGYLKVYFDDGTVVRGATVSLFDAEHRVIWEGETGQDGRVKMPEAKYARAVAEDGLGHRATLLADQTVTPRGIPRYLAAGLGVAFFIFVAALARFIQNQRAARSNN
jgi:hypothetical protein